MITQKFVKLLGAISTIALISPICANAVITFEKTFGGAECDRGYSVQQTTDGGYIIVGITESFGAGDFDVYLIKTDSLGDTLWTKTFGGTDYDEGSSIQVTSDGGYIITGSIHAYGDIEDTSDVYLIKIDSSGNKEWDRTYGGDSADYGKSVQQTQDGGYIIAGVTESYSAGSYDVWLIKTNSAGNKLWDKTFGGNSADYGNSVQQTSDGGFIVTGGTVSYGTGGSSDMWLIKTDSLGNKEWDKTFGGPDGDGGSCVQQTSDGGYIITGNFQPLDYLDVWLIKTDTSGDTLWTKTFGGTPPDAGKSVAQTSDGGYLITGHTQSYGAGSADVYLIKTDENGNTLWTKTFGGSSWDVGSSVTQTSDGGYIIAGYTESYGAGGDVYLIKTDSLGNVYGIEETENRLETADYRLQVHPNPFITKTEFRFQMVENVGQGFSLANLKVCPTLNIYDLSGRLVKNFSVPPVSSVASVTWDSRNESGKRLPSGIYFLRFEADHYKTTKKLTVLR